MTLQDIISKNPNKNQNETEAISEYIQIAERLISILPDEYKLDDVCEYVWLPYGVAGCNEEKLKEKAQSITNRSENLKISIKESLKPVEKLVDWAKYDFWVHLIGDVIIGSILFGILNLTSK